MSQPAYGNRARHIRLVSHAASPKRTSCMSAAKYCTITHGRQPAPCVCLRARWCALAGRCRRVEMYRVFREYKFMEDEGNIVFYKNARGLAKMRPIFNSDASATVSGIEITDCEKRTA
ncbi:hypothetical protein K438DRAFT_1998502 [Mycena galopus ATCC 62051]|nr:hypothetical protein K438DRAFT_1998502 [Mycena galopus ATCC 62051]